MVIPLERDIWFIRAEQCPLSTKSAADRRAAEGSNRVQLSSLPRYL
jgi:hypothetical protein